MEYGFKPTTNGRALIAACGALEQPLKLTRVTFGSGLVSEGTNLADQHQLVTPVADGTIGERMHENDRLYLSVQYDNSKHPEQEAFNLAEFIIYAMHPETQTETDVAYATLGDYQQPVPAYSADLPASIFSFPMVLVVSDEIEVFIAAAPGVVTHNDLQQLLNEGVIGISKQEITIPTEGWSSDPAGAGDAEAEGGDFSSDYPQQLDIEIATVTARMTPILTIHPESLADADGICPTCQTLDGKLRLFAKTAPKAELQATLGLVGGSGRIEFVTE